MKTGKIIAGTLISVGGGAVAYFGFIKKFDGVTGWKQLMGKFGKKDEKEPTKDGTTKTDTQPDAVLSPPRKEEKKSPPPQPLIDWKKGDVLYAMTDLNFYKKPDATEENRLGTIKKLNSVGRFDSINTRDGGNWTKLSITRKDRVQKKYITKNAYVPTSVLTNKTF